MNVFSSATVDNMRLGGELTSVCRNPGVAPATYRWPVHAALRGDRTPGPAGGALEAAELDDRLVRESASPPHSLIGAAGPRPALAPWRRAG